MTYKIIPLSNIAKDITGITFGMLTAIAPVGKSKDSTIMWLCNCECGGTATVRSYALRNGATRSCGCLQVKHIVRLGKNNKRHGMAGNTTYKSWQHMKERCHKPNTTDYHRYGGRGITVCKRWLESFDNFLQDMGVKPEGLTIDRIDNDGNYTPENCRWATLRQQANNTRANKHITHNGITLTQAQWSRRLGISPATIIWRLKRWDIEDVFAPPSERKSRHKRGSSQHASKLTESIVLSIRSDTRLAKDIALEYGVSESTIGRVRNRNTWKHV